jgi:hypothetical protein
MGTNMKHAVTAFKLFLALACSLAIAPVAAHAAILTTYSFTGATTGTTGPFAAESPDPGVIAGNLTGTGITAPGVVGAFSAATDSSSPTYTFDGRGFEIQADLMTNNSTGAVPANHYFSFTVTPTAGNAILYTSLSMDFGYDMNIAAAGTIMRYDLFYSTDGVNFFQQGTASSVTGTDNAYAITNDLTKSFTGNPAFASPLTGTVTFQLRFADSNSSSASKRLFLDDIKLNGTVSAVPEPSIVLLVASGLGLLAWRQVRRRAA